MRNFLGWGRLVAAPAQVPEDPVPAPTQEVPVPAPAPEELFQFSDEDEEALERHEALLQAAFASLRAIVEGRYSRSFRVPLSAGALLRESRDVSPQFYFALNSEMSFGSAAQGSLSPFAQLLHALDEEAKRRKNRTRDDVLLAARFNNVLPYAWSNCANFGCFVSPSVVAHQWPLDTNLPDLERAWRKCRCAHVILLGTQDTPDMPAYWNMFRGSRFKAVSQHLEQCRFETRSSSILLTRFAEWRDFSSPSDEQVDTVLRLAQYVREATPQRRVFIHCRAGVGRTGTILLIAKCIDWLLQHEEETSLPLYELWLQLRAHRCLLVQVPQQLSFVFRALARYLQLHPELQRGRGTPGCACVCLLSLCEKYFLVL
ncbi:MAG: hypothetical protein MHM6MM_004224 [Cercozoa sp. M6MM]